MIRNGEKCVRKRVFISFLANIITIHQLSQFLFKKSKHQNSPLSKGSYTLTLKVKGKSRITQ